MFSLIFDLHSVVALSFTVSPRDLFDLSGHFAQHGEQYMGMSPDKLVRLNDMSAFLGHI